jgi:signal transduction histidine kinase
MRAGSVTDEGSRAGKPSPTSPLPTWREDTLRSMLGVIAVVGPVAGVFAAFGRSPRPLIDALVVLAVGFSMPVLRFLPGLTYAVRAAAVMLLLFAGGIFVLARVGLSPGASLLFAAASVFGAIYSGRVVAYATVLLGALAFAVVGWLVADAVLPLPNDIFEVRSLGNWLRVGGIFAAIATLLTSGVAFVISRVEASARDLRVAYERLGLLHLRLESSKEEERRFLAHELHDELGQLLTALKLRVQLAARGGSGGAAPAEAETLALIDDLIGRVRRMSVNLRPPLLDEVGLVPAVRAYLETQAAISGVAMDLEAGEPPPGAAPLDGDVEITCFRVVQEAVTNALRHAAPRALRVRIDRGADRVAIRVSDDGRGFDVDVRLEGAAAAGHLGVVGMRERVRAHGGGFRLSSRPGAGTTIEVDLPLGPRPLGGPFAVAS